MVDNRDGSNHSRFDYPGVVYGAVIGGIITLLFVLLRLIQRIPQGDTRTIEPGDTTDSLKATPLATQDQIASKTRQVSSNDSPNVSSTDDKSGLPPQQGPEMHSLMQPGQPPEPSSRFSTPTKYLVGVFIFLSVLFVIYISRSVLSLIIIAALIAYIIQPVIAMFQTRFKLSRGVSVALTYILVVITLLLIPAIIFPATVSAVNFVLEIDYIQIIDNTIKLLETLSIQVSNIPIIGPALVPAMDTLLNALLGFTDLENPEAIDYDISLANISTRLAQTLGLLVNILGPIVSAIFSFVFMLLISVHLSISGNKFMGWFLGLVPSQFQTEIEDLVDRIELIWASFLRSQLVLMIVVGVLVWLGNWVLGTPQAFFLGVIAGLLEIIPNLGPLIATIPAVILAVFFGSSYLPVNNLIFALIIIVFYILVQTFENQVLVPKILGDAVDLPPAIVIIGVVIGGATAGILGVFLSTPIIASGREIYGYLYDKIIEPPPPETPPEEKPSMGQMVQGWLRGLKLPVPWRSKPEPEQ